MRNISPIDRRPFFKTSVRCETTNWLANQPHLKGQAVDLKMKIHSELQGWHDKHGTAVRENDVVRGHTSTATRCSWHMASSKRIPSKRYVTEQDWGGYKSSCRQAGLFRQVSGITATFHDIYDPILSGQRQSESRYADWLDWLVYNDETDNSRMASPTDSGTCQSFQLLTTSFLKGKSPVKVNGT